MSPRSTTYDAIVVGGGHNGLVCAAYLARGGLRVVVLEARGHIGGMAETSELAPGVRVPTLAHTVGRLRPYVIRDLHLARHGLQTFEPDVTVFAPQPDGRGLILRRDSRLTENALATNELVGTRDAAKYVAVDRRVRALADALAPLLDRAPPDFGAQRLDERLRAGLASRRPGRGRGANLLRAMPMPVRDLVDGWFESDALRAAIAARGVFLSGLGPRMPGTAGVLLTDIAGTEAGLAGHTVYARGGPGTASDALAAAAEAAGVELRTEAQVVAVRRTGWSATGVALASGEEIDAAVVVSTLDPRTTLLKLLEPEVVGPRLSWRATNIRQRGTTGKVNFALSGLPAFAAATDEPRRLEGRILLAPSLAALDEAARPVKYDEMPERPMIEATIPTLTDATLIDAHAAGRVRHVLSAVVNWVPFDVERDLLAGQVTRTIEEYAPGFSDLVEHRAAITPADLESDWGADGGHAMHAEIGLDQWFEWRPLHGMGRYRMPLDGMYLGGSGSHPGGGVTGAPGALAAREVLTDVKASRRRVSA